MYNTPTLLLNHDVYWSRVLIGDWSRIPMETFQGRSRTKFAVLHKVEMKMRTVKKCDSTFWHVVIFLSSWWHFACGALRSSTYLNFFKYAHSPKKRGNSTRSCTDDRKWHGLRQLSISHKAACSCYSPKNPWHQTRQDHMWVHLGIHSFLSISRGSYNKFWLHG